MWKLEKKTPHKSSINPNLQSDLIPGLSNNCVFSPLPPAFPFFLSARRLLKPARDIQYFNLGARPGCPCQCQMTPRDDTVLIQVESRALGPLRFGKSQKLRAYGSGTASSRLAESARL